MKICIPSKNRAETITTHLFFDPKDILIFVEPQEIRKYKIFNPEYKFIDIKKNDKGLAYARNYILDYMKQQNIIMADDDYKQFGKRNKEGRYEKLRNCQEIIVAIEENLKKCEACGIADDIFSFYLNKGNNNKRIYTNKQIMRDFYGINMSWIKSKNIKYDEKLKSEGEDVDFNVMIIVNDGKICNDYLYNRKKIHRNSGGLVKERGGILNRDKAQRIHLDNLVRKYGAEFFSTSHDEYGNLKTKILKFNLIKKRPEIVRENIEKFKKENY